MPETMTGRRCPGCGGLLMLSRDYCLGCLKDVREKPPAPVPWWVDFEGREGACVEAPSAERAKEIAGTLIQNDVTAVRRLPYPANPRIGTATDCPSFCTRGKRCAGHTACPERYSCSE